MISIGILALILGFVFLYLYQNQAKSGKVKLKSADRLRALQQQQQAHKDELLSIEDVEKGGVIHLDDVGLRAESFDAQIIARHLHKVDSDRIIELEADRGGSKVYISIERDDELSVDVTLTQPSLASLGISAKDIDNFVDDQKLNYDGTEYYADYYNQAIFCRDSNELNPEPYEFWDFADEDEEQYITIVRWQDGTVEANYSVVIKPRNITVYSRS
ncbi:MAG: DUF4178 domain-containing protein [Deltaproteobacteria bacterium]|nr:DUF4178 domain-containing protein [Deltaproteobacteria bacterium]